MKIRKAIKKDKDWILEIFSLNKVILGGKGYGSLQWKRFWENNKPNENWIVIEKIAFCHYLCRYRDRVNVIYEIATHDNYKRKGYGKKLIKHIGKPIELKTDYDNIESNNFYKSIGFKENGLSFTKSNKKMQKFTFKNPENTLFGD